MGSHFTATHWGVYLPRVEDGRVVALAPAPWDASPKSGQGQPQAGQITRKPCVPSRPNCSTRPNSQSR